MNSIWVDDIKRIRFEPLKQNKSTDVLIIGGGIAGILCAYKLKQKGIDCILVEADQICGGITKNTTAKITFAHGLIYDKIINKYGEDIARLHLEAQIDACEEYNALCQNIECNYEKKNSYVYSLQSIERIENEISALKRLGIDAKMTNTLGLPFKVAGAVCVQNQAQFHPLKFLISLSRDLPIYENTKIIELMPNKAITQYGEITYKKAIITTHFPILNKHGGYFLKMYQHRSYVLALSTASKVEGMYVDESDKGLSFRTFGELLLLGGGGHRTGKSGGSYGELENFAKKYYPQAKIVGRWATQDCMTLDKIAYIGQYSKSTPDLLVATGFNKWGMSTALAAANILCDLVQGNNNKYEKVFLPSRSILHSQLIVNAFETTVSMLTPTAPRCPHLGCALKYNYAEHSWDCPCHGSRFTEKGELIDNPATDDKML